MLTFRFTGADGCMVVYEMLTSGMVGKEVKLEFSSDWENIRKTAVFMAGTTKIDVLNVTETAVIPSEVLIAGNCLHVGIYGVSEDGTKITPTIYARGPKIRPGTDPSGDESTDPTLPVWAQLDQRVTNLEENETDNGSSNSGQDGADGEDGATFTPAVAADGTLTWTNDKGLTNPDPVNIKGPKGDTGATGPRGETGATGSSGADGYTPVKGSDYWTDSDKQEIIDETAAQMCAVRYTAQELTTEQRAQARENIGAAEAVGVIPAYWEKYLEEKISTIKELQRAGGKDCYSFVVIADYHRHGNLGKRSPVLIKKIMDECGIKFCLCLGDMQSGGAWKTKELELAEWEEIENEFAPIRDRTLMIPGNHDGSYGSADINGDGEISGTTDYYIFNLTQNEMFDLVYRKVSLINGVTFDESCNGYYVDDSASKVRYILVNTHYSNGAVNENGTAVNNYMRKMRVGQFQQDMVIEALHGVPADDWNVVVGAHMPLSTFYGEGGSGDLPLLREVLTAYQNKETYTGTYGTEGNYDYVSVSADFTKAKGAVVGSFAGHLHEDLSSAEYAFPIITTSSDDTSTAKIDHVLSAGEAGTVTEQSFDVFTVNKRTGAMYATKIGYGEDRVFGESDDTADDTVAAYKNLADPTSADWIESAVYNGGVVVASDGKNWRATNFIPVTQYDVIRFKGLNLTTADDAYYPRLVLYDESKTYISLEAFTEGGTNSIAPVITTDENGVTSYEILIRGTTGEQFTYQDWCTKVKYVRFYCYNDTPAEDVVITINEEII